MANYDYKDELAAAGKNKALFADQLNILQQTEKITDDITQNFEDQLDIGKELAENEKNIFKHRVNLKAIGAKLKKAKQEEAKLAKDASQAEKDHASAAIATLTVLLKQAKGQKRVRDEVDKTLIAHQKTMKPVKKLAGMIPGIGSTLSSAMDAYSVAFEKGLEGSMEGLTDKQKDAKKNFMGMTAGVKVVGLAIAAYIGKNLLSAMQSTGAGLMDILKRPEFIFFGAESRAIAEEFGNLDQSSMKLGLNMKMMAFFTGVTAENQAKILGAMAATSDSSLDVLQSQMMAYKKAGVPFKAIMDDVAGNTEFFAKFAKDGGANIMDAAARAKELGINLGDVASISSSLLDFESSIEKQMEAQVLLGRNLNLDKARQLAFSGDTVGLQNEILRQVGSEAEFNKMNYLQREALAGAIGLNVERLGALVRKEGEAAETANEVKWSWVAIGVAVGAIVGLIASLKGVFTGGLTTGKDIATMAKYSAGGAAATGTAVAAASMAIPKMADGGIINTPTLALIGEKGPEAVIPLADGAGATTLTKVQQETNRLLVAILGSNEKIGRNTSDMVTA